MARCGDPRQHVVVPARVDRERVQRGLGVVEHRDPGRRAQDLARALGRELAARLHVDRLGVAVDDGHAHARRRDRDLLIAEDLARLVDQLALLVGVVVAGGEAARVGERVERDLMRVLLRSGDRAVVQQRVGLIAQSSTARLPVPETAW